MDPAERWNRSWDSQWRMTLFDLPEEKRSLRNALRKQLRAARFGCLQGSVWISPDMVDGVLNNLKSESGVEARTILFFCGRPFDGVGDADLVASAWDWKAIRNTYAEYRKHLKMLPRACAQSRQRMLEWGNLERELWSRSLSIDPLLPRKLWPRGYPGEKAWQERLRALKAAGSIVMRC
jgi:phenylacetic acid degradation operon negative regulatory protein